MVKLNKRIYSLEGKVIYLETKENSKSWNGQGEHGLST